MTTEGGCVLSPWAYLSNLRTWRYEQRPQRCTKIWGWCGKCTWTGGTRQRSVPRSWVVATSQTYIKACPSLASGCYVHKNGERLTMEPWRDNLAYLVQFTTKFLVFLVFGICILWMSRSRSPLKYIPTRLPSPLRSQVSDHRILFLWVKPASRCSCKCPWMHQYWPNSRVTLPSPRSEWTSHPTHFQLNRWGTWERTFIMGSSWSASPSWLT